MGSLEGTVAENGGATEAAAAAAAPSCNGKQLEENGNAADMAQMEGPPAFPGADCGDGPAAAGVITRKGRSGAVVSLPLEVGTRLLCRWRDGKFHPVKVIERRKLPPTVSFCGGGHEYEYYVHYTECELPSLMIGFLDLYAKI